VELHDVVTSEAANWEPPGQEVVTYYHRAAAILVDPASPFRFWLASMAGQPVAACESFLGAGVSGVYAVVTRKAYRRRAIETAMVRPCYPSHHEIQHPLRQVHAEYPKG
jgi:hypothetical protein